MSDDIRPALSPEKWFQVQSWYAAPLGAEAPTAILRADPANRHAVAATCLYGQPFGFTREDVALLRDMVREFSLQHMPTEPCSCFVCSRNRDVAPRLRTLRDKVAALLPPEDVDKPVDKG